ncbi:hypothetical protein ACWDUN_04690 [Mycobacterium sp. NPDC003323]
MRGIQPATDTPATQLTGTLQPLRLSFTSDTFERAPADTAHQHVIQHSPTAVT